ncbi:hypothetical protein SeMB42_g05495 [Synchytrium endobioticum]|uniref:non-specific serine/threonine protein kinase n=1 Tax=Synchytrium endobioticum TaxID=286115 RepID=A0A507CR42_9FUNG|nr:hypothetical protein SeLEV6574_g06098 [Synchytrium endobioticum]TPX41632.1 hypothetical protein SeMB42_g05495 [Synchytrium endobioticum]
MSYEGRRRDTRDARRGAPPRLNYQRYDDPWSNSSSPFNVQQNMANAVATTQYTANSSGPNPGGRRHQRVLPSTSQRAYLYANNTYGSPPPPLQDAIANDAVAQAKVGRAQSLLQRIFKDNDDPTFAKRVAAAAQLEKLIASLGDHGESADIGMPYGKWTAQAAREYLLTFNSQEIEFVLLDASASEQLKQAISRCISAAGTAFRADILPFYDWLFAKLNAKYVTTNNRRISPEQDRDMKTHLLVALREVVQYASIVKEKNNTVAAFSYPLQTERLLEYLQVFLDAMESPDYLPRVLDVLHAVADRYPKAFQIAFMDVADRLVGWHIDESLSKSIWSLIADSFKKFWPFWRSHSAFGLDLLQHLLTDIVAVGQPNSHKLPSIANIYIRCFHSVFAALCFSFFPTVNSALPQAAEDAMVQERFACIAQQLLGTFYSFSAKYKNDVWITTSSDIIRLLSRAYEGSCRMVPMQQTAFDCLLIQLEALLDTYDGPPEDLLADQTVGWKEISEGVNTWIEGINEVFGYWGSELAPSVVDKFINPSSPLLSRLRIRCSGDAKTLSRLLSLCRKSLVIGGNEKKTVFKVSKEPPLLTELDVMLRYIKNSQDVELPSTQAGLQPHSLQALIAFDALLCTDACTKGVFEFEVDTVAMPIIRHLEVLCFRQTPGCTSRVVGVLFWCLHEVNVSARYFLKKWPNICQRSLRLMCTHLTPHGVTMDLKRIALNWFGGVIDTIKTVDVTQECEAFLDSGALSCLALADLDLNGEVREIALRTLNEYLLASPSSQKRLPQIYELLMRRLQDGVKAVGNQSYSALLSLNAITTMTMAHDSVWHDDVSAVKLEIIKSPLLGTFRTRHFSTLAWYMGLAPLNPPPEEAEEMLSDWRERIFHACQGESALKIPPGAETPSKQMSPSSENLLHRIHLNDALLMYWSAWEAARYCITARLRTPYGTPPQTFDAIEHALTGLVKAAEGIETGETPLDMAPAVLSRLRELITFLEALEVQIPNAAEGSGLHLALAPRTSAAFFHANRKVCDEWYQRLRGRMLHGARISGLPVASVIRQAQLLLGERHASLLKGSTKDWNGWAKDVERGMEDLTTALITSRNADAIAGLVIWSNVFGNAGAPTISKVTELAKPPVITIQKRTPDPVADAKPPELSFPYLSASVLMAQGKLEDAVTGFMSVMPPIFENRDSKVGGWNFLLQQITECYIQLNDITGMKDWLNMTEQRQVMFEEENPLANIRSLEYLQMWSNPTVIDQEEFSIPALPYFRLIDVGLHQATSDFIDHYVLGRLLGQFNGGNNAVIGLQSTFEALALADKADVCRLLGRAQLARNVERTLSSSSALGVLPNLAWSPVSGCEDLQQWTNYHMTLSLMSWTTSLVPASHLEEASLFIARVARKQGNTHLASRLLSTSVNSNVRLHSLQQYQTAKLQFAESLHVDAMKTILCILQSTATGYLSDMRTKMWRRLARWSSEGHYDFTALELKSLLVPVIGAYDAPVSGIANHITQAALEAATRESPGASKAWLEFGNFWYRRGRKLLEEAASGRFDGELEPLREYLSRNSDSCEIERVLGPLVLWELGESADGSADEGQGSESQSETSIHVQNTLRLGFADLSLASIEEATRMVLEIRQRVLKYFDAASQSYFTYLQSGDSSTVATTHDGAVEKCNEITVTLRLLRLLVKYGSNLGGTFHAGLECTPSRVWSNIVPQLFARLYHHDRVVQRELLALIARIALELPSQIVYHAVVGAKSTRFGEAAHVVYSQSLSALRAIGNGTELLVDEVELLTTELHRITVLPEERWLHKLGHMAGDVARRFERVNKETARIMANATMVMEDKNRIVRDTYTKLLKPVIGTVDKLIAETLDCGAKSVYDTWFANEYGSRIRDALEMLRSPTDYNNPKRAWDAFNQLYNDLSKLLNRNRTLKLSDMSPILSSKRNWAVPVPGSLDASVYIDRFESDVYVIATKTKPKKIDILGSDGKHYPFLFKGLEDLHLDERVSQFLSTANYLLQRDRQSASRQLRARHYAVVPLGDNHGMIQWVTNVTPMFTLYKRWQMSSSRVQSAPPQNKETNKSNGNKKESNDGPKQQKDGVIRPLEAFHGKVNAALKRHGLSRSSPRSRWPAHVLREVYLELKNETPNNLLEREIWFSSPDSTTWWKKVACYNRSLAVMSVIGYILGLGDRHLDNLLLDLQSGDCVHIDYNVCFEKGRKLRVPEVVPFRLTQNLERGLGLTGVEGMYRLAAEHTMRVMRQNKEVLITLLEAFVYDPLVDWTHSFQDVQQESTKKFDDATLQVIRRLHWVAIELNRLAKLGPGVMLVDQHWQSVATEEPLQSAHAAEQLPSVVALSDDLELLVNSVMLVAEEFSESPQIHTRVQDFMTETSLIRSIYSELHSYSGFSAEPPVMRDLSRWTPLIEQLHNHLESVISTASSFSTFEPLDVDKQDGNIIGDNTGLESVEGALDPAVSPQRVRASLDSALPPTATVVESPPPLTEDGESLPHNQHEIPGKESSPQGQQLSLLRGSNPVEVHRKQISKMVLGQERNAHAIQALKRVRAKLDGRDGGDSHRLGVAEQVDMIIKQATSVDNLAVMYEGWMPWI